MLHSREEATALIKAKAKELGFSDIGISQATHLEQDSVNLQAWLDSGFNASMAYMENYFDKRTDASKLVEGAKSVISLLVNYYPSVKQNPDSPVLAKYAYGNDYHNVLKAPLNLLLDYIKSEIDSSAEGRFFTDSAPILERAYAVKAGLGWIGKNSNLIHKRLGSFCFIAEVVINIELTYDTPIQDACGGCSRCIDACPTLAITDLRTIDSNKCISFLTIENKSDVIDLDKDSLQNRLYGCDICQDVCPWNWKARPNDFIGLEPRMDILQMTHVDWFSLTQERFSTLFKESPIKRAKFGGVERNLKAISRNSPIL